MKLLKIVIWFYLFFFIIFFHFLTVFPYFPCHILICACWEQILLLLPHFKQPWYGTSWSNEERYNTEIWYTHSSRPYVKMFFFLFFRKSDPEDRQPRKTAVWRRFSAYLLDRLVFRLFWYRNWGYKTLAYVRNTYSMLFLF